MKSLVVYCHPCADSFSAAMKQTVVTALTDSGHEVRLIDLYAENFNPVMCDQERREYHDAGTNELPVADHIAAIRWCDTLVFVYPTWWYGLPAMLKGWLDRVWVPHVTFIMPTDTTPIRPNMQHIKRLAAVTTCGAPWTVSKLIGEPGKKTILRGIRALCTPGCKTLYLAHYKMDTTSQTALKSYLLKIDRKIRKFALN
ncbi:MAG: NAD(P)H-dependent oxidoreductase [Alphaproteobacteria bacterium]